MSRLFSALSEALERDRKRWSAAPLRRLAGPPAVIGITEFTAQINAVRVAPAFLGEVMAMPAGLPAAERDDFDARTWRVFGMLEEKRLGNAGSSRWP